MQIFHRSFNVISKVTILGGILLIALLSWVLWMIARSDFVTGTYVAVEQPVAFSHEHHVTQLGIDCRYCHATAETSSSAGMPTTKTCMNCHSQIWTKSPLLEPVRVSYRENKPIEWTRVHRLVDFVHFNHSIHVRKGIGCSSCHGRVDQMPLTWKVASLQMDWCLDCHRQPAERVRPLESIYDMAWAEESISLPKRMEFARDYHAKSEINCSICHY